MMVESYADPGSERLFFYVKELYFAVNKKS